MLAPLAPLELELAGSTWTSEEENSPSADGTSAADHDAAAPGAAPGTGSGSERDISPSHASFAVDGRSFDFDLGAEESRLERGGHALQVLTAAIPMGVPTAAVS